LKTPDIDVDEAMLAAGAKFVRFNDDYRIPVGSHAEGYRRLASLADVLYRNHGLTLQPQKTTVLSRDDYVKRSQRSPEERELDSLYVKFQQLVDDLDLSSFDIPPDGDRSSKRYARFNSIHMALMPPSTTKAIPVTHSASGEVGKSTQCATS
jgi:hypothetical protein